MGRVAVIALLAAVACADPLTSDKTNVLTWQARNIEGYARTATGEPPEVLFGWGFAIEGDTARWYECSASDTCGGVKRERPKQDVLAVECVGKAAVGDAAAVDVLKLTVAPGRQYVVPYANPVPATRR